MCLFQILCIWKVHFMDDSQYFLLPLFSNLHVRNGGLCYWRLPWLPKVSRCLNLSPFIARDFAFFKVHIISSSSSFHHFICSSKNQPCHKNSKSKTTLAGQQLQLINRPSYRCCARATYATNFVDAKVSLTTGARLTPRNTPFPTCYHTNLVVLGQTIRA